MTWSAVALAAAAVAPLTAQDGDFEWRGDLEPGEVLEVKGITGSIQAVLASGRSARVTARKRGSESDFDEVEIRVVEDPDGITICAVYGDRGRDGSSCRTDWDDDDRDDRDRRKKDVDVSVDYVVELPEGVDFYAAMVTGDVEVDDVRSDVNATSVTGDVVVSTTGSIEATSVSGDLDLRPGRVDRSRRYRSVSGDITMRLPADLEADVTFESLSGDLDSDFELDVEDRDDRWIGSSISGTIGDGGPRLSFSTVSGDVRLLRDRARAR